AVPLHDGGDLAADVAAPFGVLRLLDRRSSRVNVHEIHSPTVVFGNNSGCGTGATAVREDRRGPVRGGWSLRSAGAHGVPDGRAGCDTLFVAPRAAVGQ